MSSRSCLALCSVALAAFAQACSSSPGRSEARVPLGLGRIWDFQGSLFCQGRLVENGDPSRGWERGRTARSAFARFCRQGEPVTDLREAIRFVIPRVPAGIPLDEAAMGRQRLLSQVRGILQAFYVVTSSWSGEEPASARSCGVDEGSRPYFYGLAVAEKGIHGSDPLEAGLRAPAALPDWNDLGSYLFIRSSGVSSRIYLTRNRAFRFEVPGEEDPAAGGVLYSLADGRLSEPLATHWPGRGTLVASAGPIWFRVGGGESEGRGPEALRAVFPLRRVGLGDAAVLKRLFTLAVPRETLERELGAQAAPGVEAGGDLPFSTLVRRRAEIWDAYFLRHTRVREAMNEDARVIDYEVSLDLGLFCRYGRPVKDLVTR